jgi:transcriptional regulator with XRE-family HTH domain
MTLAKKEPRPVDKFVGCQIRVRRSMMGLTQEGLATRLGLTFQQVQKYEKGTNRVGASRLQQIAEVLETSPAWFFEGAPGVVVGGPRNPGSEAADAVYLSFMEDRLAAELMNGFVKLPPTLKRSIVNLIAAATEHPATAEHPAGT